MLVPRYWSEASQRERRPDGSQTTVRRFGWSSSSQADADVHARRRLEEALAVLRAGGAGAFDSFTRRERTVAYGGPDGLPIREEIVLERPGVDAVVTRNAYGALCLNTARAMFVDVDRPPSRVGGYGCASALAGAAVGAIAAPAWLGWHVAVGVAVGLVGAGLLGSAARRAVEQRDPQARAPLRWATERTRTWCDDRPAWRVAVYETPHGARLLPVHAGFDADDPEAAAFMAFVRADPLYVRIGRTQKCFRARVSPKPWRVGIEAHFRTGGTWPVRDPGKLAARAAWVAAYDVASRGHASCRLVELVGTGRADAGIDAVRRLHDELARATSSLPLA